MKSLDDPRIFVVEVVRHREDAFVDTEDRLLLAGWWHQASCWCAIAQDLDLMISLNLAQQVGQRGLGFVHTYPEHRLI